MLRSADQLGELVTLTAQLLPPIPDAAAAMVQDVPPSPYRAIGALLLRAGRSRPQQAAACDGAAMEGAAARVVTAGRCGRSAGEISTVAHCALACIISRACVDLLHDQRQAPSPTTERALSTCAAVLRPLCPAAGEDKPAGAGGDKAAAAGAAEEKEACQRTKFLQDNPELLQKLSADLLPPLLKVGQGDGFGAGAGARRLAHC